MVKCTVENNKAEQGARKRVIREFLQRNGPLNQDLRKWRRKPWEQVKGSVSLGRGNSLCVGGDWKQAWLVWVQQGGQRGWEGVSEAQKATVEERTDGGRGGWKLLSNCRHIRWVRCEASGSLNKGCGVTWLTFPQMITDGHIENRLKEVKNGSRENNWNVLK